MCHCFEELDDDAKKEANKLLVEQNFYRLYDAYSAKYNPPMFHALWYQQTLQGQIVGLIGMLLLDGERAVQSLLMASKWQIIPNVKGIPCQLEYLAEAVERNRMLEEK